MPRKNFAKSSIEVLEQRIAPAAIVPLNEAGFRQASAGANLLHAGEGISTGGAGSGQYLLYVEKGTALVFITDLNNNSQVDPNEITGIAAGDGLQIVSFVDIHGDIVTNLTPGEKLSDLDRNKADDPSLGGDGLVLLNSTIAKIELRSVRDTDFQVTPATDLDSDGVVDPDYINNRLALSTYSIFGNIMAGKGFGVSGGGLIIDKTGEGLQQTKFTGVTTVDYFLASEPTIGSILTGTAAGGKVFSFGISERVDIYGRLGSFQPAPGQAGGDIIGVKSPSASPFNINTLQAGGGGIGARGGNIQDVELNGDDSGYLVIAGNGGRGPSGGAGGNIVNLADLGSATGYVLIKSGDGGAGSTGAGGNGGTVSLGTMNLAAPLNFQLGSGGNGFTSGGNGASFTRGDIAPIEGAVVFGQAIVGTKHVPGTIGNNDSVDFDGDGIGDLVYSTAEADQVVVLLGGTGEKVFLQAPANVRAITVGDFNDDGRDDIALGSADLGNAGGISVFLNEFNASGTAFTGFSLGSYSPLPTLYRTENQTLFWGRSANGIGSITAGDFNGDGNTDLAVIASYHGLVSLQEAQLLLVMQNDVENGKATGRFYGEFGTKGAGDAVIPRVALGTGTVGSYIAKSSAFQAGDTTDIIYAANTTGDASGASVFTYELAAPNPAFPTTFAPALLGSYRLGGVDTNRALLQGTSANITIENATRVLDFAILDFGSAAAAPLPVPNVPGGPDGVADLAILLQAPQGFVVTVLGNTATRGSGILTAASNPNAGSQNSGIFFGDLANGAGGFNVGTVLQQIRATDSDRDGVMDEIAVLNYSSDTRAYTIHEVSLTNTTPAAALNNGLGVLDASYTSAFNGVAVVPRDPSVIAFDSYRNESGGDSWSYLAASPNKDATFGRHLIEINGSITGSFTQIDNGIAVSTGVGGSALIGKGGTGGIIGGGLRQTTDTTTALPTSLGTINITIPANPAYSGTISFTGGDGGNGFSTGGSGGKVSGVSVRYADTATLLSSRVNLTGGTGGFGVTGAGGGGGDVSANSIQSGENFQGGDGGRGATGGKGGSVLGNGFKAIYDSSDSAVRALAGAGGDGVKRGGEGGDVSGFRVQFLPRVGGAGGEIYYTGGNGGNAASGAGGRGGNVSNSSPFAGLNQMSGEIYLQGGDGGSGSTGGAGGAILNFTNTPSVGDNPTIVSLLGGNGGNGTSGRGGVGGAIANVSTPSVGKQDLNESLSLYNFNRVVAGSGGDSGGSTGGVGGTITKVNVSSSDGAVAFIAGAGGYGLGVGGAGGSVVNASTTVGRDAVAKILVIAGAGGDAYAFTQNPLDNPTVAPQKPFGGRVGQGGAGGSITGFSEDIGVQARVDLIAGNGGNTVNYGTITSKGFVGRGGSISNASIAGNIGSGFARDITDISLTPEGRLAANVPIRSYTDLDGNGVDDQTVDEFVQANFRFKPTDVFVPITLDDSIGNVGIIVGAAGRIKATQSSPGIFTSEASLDGVNGSLSGIKARNLMSAVAGSVNQIAAIQSVSGLSIGFGSGSTFSPGVVGSDKDPTRLPFPVGGIDPTPGSSFDYLDANGQGILEPQIGGRLVDGALVASRLTGFVSGRVYLR